MARGKRAGYGPVKASDRGSPSRSTSERIGIFFADGGSIPTRHAAARRAAVRDFVHARARGLEALRGLTAWLIPAAMWSILSQNQANVLVGCYYNALTRPGRSGRDFAQLFPETAAPQFEITFQPNQCRISRRLRLNGVHLARIRGEKVILEMRFEVIQLRRASPPPDSRYMHKAYPEHGTQNALVNQSTRWQAIL